MSISLRILIVFLICFSSLTIAQISLAQTNSTLKLFEDPKTGISFQYPPDWQVASKEYTEASLGIPGSMDNLSSDPVQAPTSAVVMLFPESLNGANFNIVSELLPFKISLDKYVKLSTRYLSDSSIQSSDIMPFSIGNLTGSKYDISMLGPDNQSINQTQIIFVKGLKAFVITYSLGATEQSKNINEINSIIRSVAIK